MIDGAKRIYLAGHTGLVGSAVLRQLQRTNVDVITRSHSALDLTNQSAVNGFFATSAFDYVIVAAARVGGILANSRRPADFIRDNLSIALNVIDAADRANIGRLLFLGSSCIYPRLAPQPIPEEALMSGPLESTNEAYAIAKIAGIKMCQAINRQKRRCYLSLMPANIYGPGDNFNQEDSHVVPGLIRRFVHASTTGAPEVVVWGSGRPRREFLFVDDLALACFHVVQDHDQVVSATGSDVLNVGSGTDITISDLAYLIAEVTGYHGRIVFDPSMPDGTPRKCLDIKRMRTLGWSPQIDLVEGLTRTVQWYKHTIAEGVGGHGEPREPVGGQGRWD